MGIRNDKKVEKIEGTEEKSKKKYYAVRRGRKPGIYNSWMECKEQTHGFPRPRFKGFFTMEAAVKFMNGDDTATDVVLNTNDKTTDTTTDALPKQNQLTASQVAIKPSEGVSTQQLEIMIEEIIERKMIEYNLVGHSQSSSEGVADSELKAPEQQSLDLEPIVQEESVPYVAYVDGGYYSYQKVVGYGAIIFNEKRQRTQISGATEDERYLSAHNVSGELLATKIAVIHALTHGATDLHIFHDYEGISKWATGEWQARKPIPMAYKEFMEEYQQKINITFTKVKSHSGVKHNEEVDRLVGDAIKEHIKFSR